MSVNPSATTTYTIATLADGTCTAQAVDMSGSAVVTVNPRPGASISYDESPYCPTGRANVTVTGTGGGSYSTQSSDLALNPVTGAIDLAASKPGSYIVTYAFSSAACDNSTAAQIIINSPVDAPTAVGASGCGPGPVALKATGSGGTLKWYSDAGLTAQVGTGPELHDTKLVEHGHLLRDRNQRGRVCQQCQQRSRGDQHSPQCALSHGRGVVRSWTGDTQGNGDRWDAQVVRCESDGTGGNRTELHDTKLVEHGHLLRDRNQRGRVCQQCQQRSRGDQHSPQCALSHGRGVVRSWTGDTQGNGDRWDAQVVFRCESDGTGGNRAELHDTKLVEHGHLLRDRNQRGRVCQQCQQRSRGDQHSPQCALSHGRGVVRSWTGDTQGNGDRWDAQVSSDASLTAQVGTGPSFTTPSLSSTATYYVTETSTAGCVGSASSAVATINSAPNAPLAGGGESCGPGPVPLKATGSGGILKWYSDAGLTVQVGSGPSFTTPNLSGTTTYYVTETSAAGCVSSASSVSPLFEPCRLPRSSRRLHHLLRGRRRYAGCWTLALLAISGATGR